MFLFPITDEITIPPSYSTIHFISSDDSFLSLSKDKKILFYKSPKEIKENLSFDFFIKEFTEDETNIKRIIDYIKPKLENFARELSSLSFLLLNLKTSFFA